MVSVWLTSFKSLRLRARQITRGQGELIRMEAARGRLGARFIHARGTSIVPETKSPANVAGDVGNMR